MKKVVIAISALCYLVVTCGITINAHYCMNKLASVHLFGAKPELCGQCGMKIHQSNGCCHDETAVVKLEQDQNKVPAVNFELPSPEITAILPSAFIATAFYNVDEQRHFHNHSPPLLSAQDTYLQINVFRI